MNPLSDGTLYSHWSEVRSLPWAWRNFTPQELASRGNGEFYWHLRTFDALQHARDILGHALHVNSAHRDWLYNIAIGGAPRSAHLFIAVDISTRNQNRARIYHALQKAGFQSFGFYKTFIHADLRPGRQWYGSHESKVIWSTIRQRRIPNII